MRRSHFKSDQRISDSRKFHCELAQMKYEKKKKKEETSVTGIKLSHRFMLTSSIHLKIQVTCSYVRIQLKTILDQK